MHQSAFVLRIAPSGIDKLPDALSADQIIIGWSHAAGLLDESLTWDQFRATIRDTYYAGELTLRKAGNAAGNMWRFIREMKEGDLVVVPYGRQFYVGEVSGPAIYLGDRVDDDTAYRRPVKWLNGKAPLLRQIARSALVSRMKIQGTCADASDLLDEIKECLTVVARGVPPTFQTDLKSRLIREALSEMRSGRIDSFGFENLVQTVLLGLGAQDCRIVARKEDKGADLVATFRVAGAFLQRVAVQAKHWQVEPPINHAVVEQLIRGMEAEMADLGMVVTSGSIADDAYQAAQQYFDDRGTRIELVDGEQFAALIVERGIGVSSSDESHKRPTGPRTRTIGILAYGSLIDDPGPEIGPLIRERLSGVMTPFSIEFARSSRTRNGGPTVVPVESGGAPVTATILVLDSGVSTDRAEDLLWRRETRSEAADRHYRRPDSPGLNDTIVEHLSNVNGVATVLYTRIGSNITNPSADVLADLAIKSARHESGNNGKDGISYLISLRRHGISTPLTEAYERTILEKTGTRNLQEALAHIRNLGPKGQSDEVPTKPRT